MFEIDNNTMDIIDLSTIFDNKPLNTELNNEVQTLISNTTGLFSKSNTNKSHEYVIRRPDVILTMSLLKEIMKKSIYVKYVGVNIPLNIGNLFEYTDEQIQAMETQDKRRLAANIIDYPYHTDYIAGNDFMGGSIVFVNAIRGSSFLSKFKKINFSELSNDNYTLERLKDLELELIENKFDSTTVIKVTNNRSEKATYYVVTNKHTWYKIRKMIGKTLDLYPELLIEGLNENFVNKVRFLCEKLGAEGNDNSAWQETLFSILQDEERKNQQTIIDIEKLLESTKREQESNLRRQIRRCKDNIVNFENEIREQYTNARNLEGQLLRLEQDPELKSKLIEAFEFANKSKLITMFKLKPTEKKIEMLIEAPIRYYDQNYAKALYRNLNESREYHRPKDGKVFKQLFEDLFINEKYTLMTSTKVTIIFYANGMTEPLSYGFSRQYTPDKYIGQPHLDRYSCLGNNQIEARKMCADFDLLGLIALFTNCAQNFNLTDSTVFSEFRDGIISSYDHLNTLVNNETGEETSFKDYYEEMLGQKLVLQEVILAKEKYKHYRASDAEINYLFKALKSLKEITVPAMVALELARLSNSNNCRLQGNAGNSSFYQNSNREGRAIRLTMIEDKIYGESLEKDYYHMFQNCIQKNVDNKLTYYTVLLDEYNEPTEEAVVQAVAATITANEEPVLSRDRIAAITEEATATQTMAMPF